MEEHEYVKFNPSGIDDNPEIELLGDNITKEILKDGRECYSIFFKNKIINIIRVPENFGVLKNEKAFMRMTVVDKHDKKYINSKIDDIAIID